MDEKLYIQMNEVEKTNNHRLKYVSIYVKSSLMLAIINLRVWVIFVLTRNGIGITQINCTNYPLVYT